MSIIQEALKKVQTDYIEKKPVARKEAVRKVLRLAITTRDDGLAKVFRKDRKPVPKRVIIAWSITVLFISSIVMILIGAKLFFLYHRKNAENEKALKASRLPKETPALPVAARKGAEETAKNILPPAAEVVRLPNFELNGIMYIEERPQAIINGYILQEGDSLSGATVMLIDKDYVLLNVNDSNVRLKLTK